MRTSFYITCALVALTLSACNYNNYDQNSPYRGSVAYQHADETVVRPKKTQTMTVKRDLTTTSGGTVHTRTVTETITVPDDISAAPKVKEAQRALNADDNYYEVNINRHDTIDIKD